MFFHYVYIFSRWIFRCVLASLQEALSVCRSVRRSVWRSVIHSFRSSYALDNPRKIEDQVKTDSRLSGEHPSVGQLVHPSIHWSIMYLFRTSEICSRWSGNIEIQGKTNSRLLGEPQILPISIFICPISEKIWWTHLCFYWSFLLFPLMKVHLFLSQMEQKKVYQTS